jgi:hypothetical protein
VINTGNPYQIGPAGSPTTQQTDTSSQMNQFDRENDQAKAPLILPNPLDKINPLLSNIFVTLTQIREELITQAQINPAIKEEKLKNVINKIDEINKEILDLPAHLGTITL